LRKALSFLLSPPGEALLGELAGQSVNERTLLEQTERLRRDYPADVVAAALDLTLLRRKARRKFSRADEMFLTRQALEQASAEVVARYRARRFRRYTRVADLCCGIGGDALALARRAEVLAIDHDPLRLSLVEANARAYDVADRVHTLCTDATSTPLDLEVALWADPARRAGGRRAFSVKDYVPPLAALLPAALRAPGAGIKLSPGVRYRELDAALGDTPYEVEIISVRGHAREAVLWLGELRTVRRRATLLPGEHTLTDASAPPAIPTRAPERYLYEPDPAVIRAHLVEHLAVKLSATKLDPEIAYLTSDRQVETPFARAYRIDEAMPFQLKRLNRRLRAIEIGELAIKKRGFPVDPERFRHRLRYARTPGGPIVVLILTHVQGQPTALFCRPAAR